MEKRLESHIKKFVTDPDLDYVLPGKSYPDSYDYLALLGGFFFKDKEFNRFLEEIIEDDCSIEELKKENDRFVRFDDFFKGESYEKRMGHFCYFLELMTQDLDKKESSIRKFPKYAGMLFTRDAYASDCFCVRGGGFNGMSLCQDVGGLTDDILTAQLALEYWFLWSRLKSVPFKSIEQRKSEVNAFHSLNYGVLDKIYTNVAFQVMNRSLPKGVGPKVAEFTDAWYSHLRDSPECPGIAWKFSHTLHDSPEKAIQVINEFAEFYNITPRKDKIIYDSYGRIRLP